MPAHDHHSDRKLVGVQTAIRGRLLSPRGVQRSRLFRCHRLATSRVPKTDLSWGNFGSDARNTSFLLAKTHVTTKSLDLQKKNWFTTWGLSDRIAAQNPCDDVGQLVVVADTRLRPLHDEFVATLALSLADMHLSTALWTGLSPCGRGCIKRDALVRFFGLQFLHPLFVGLQLMHCGWTPAGEYETWPQTGQIFRGGVVYIGPGFF